MRNYMTPILLVLLSSFSFYATASEKCCKRALAEIGAERGLIRQLSSSGEKDGVCNLVAVVEGISDLQKIMKIRTSEKSAPTGHLPYSHAPYPDTLKIGFSIESDYKKMDESKKKHDTPKGKNPQKPFKCNL